MKRPWILGELSYLDVKNSPTIEVAVLPLGATEPHNLHLPYATDTLQVDIVANLACKKAFEAGARVVAMPVIPYGTETNQMRFPWAINLNPTTVAAVITDIVRSLETHGVRKLVLLNGHGGNDLKWILRQLHGTTDVQIFVCHWFKVASDVHKSIFVDAGDHAGELETSMIQAHFPELVDLPKADEGSMAISRFDAVNRGWVEITRPWHLLTTNSGAGDPRPATAEKGLLLTEIVVQRIASFLVDLSRSLLDERFPFQPKDSAP